MLRLQFKYEFDIIAQSDRFLNVLVCDKHHYYEHIVTQMSYQINDIRKTTTRTTAEQ